MDIGQYRGGKACGMHARTTTMHRVTLMNVEVDARQHNGGQAYGGYAQAYLLVEGGVEQQHGGQTHCMHTCTRTHTYLHMHARTPMHTQAHMR